MTHYEGEVALGSFFDTHGGGGGGTPLSKKKVLEMNRLMLFWEKKAGILARIFILVKSMPGFMGRFLNLALRKMEHFLKP